MVPKTFRPAVFAAALALALPADIALAQTPSMPAPTTVPAGSFPSMPAPTTQPTPANQTTAPAPEYQDPLRTPIVIKTPAASTPSEAPDATTAAPTAPSPAISNIPQPRTVQAPAPRIIASVPSAPAYDYEAPFAEDRPDTLGSTYIPVDSPVYPMVMRLYSLGYIDNIFISMRPWTRRSLLHALQQTSTDVNADGNEQAQQILARLMSELSAETPGKNFTRGRVYGVDSVYTRFLGIAGIPLRDSYHLGQTIVNDYGRPYAKGFNNITGFSSINEMGRFSLYVRGEFQHAPRGDAYSPALLATVGCIDFECPTVPASPTSANIQDAKNVAARDLFRVQEATLSFHIAGHEISGGKSDAWIGPGMGGGMAWSNNAEDIYSFRINRVEPLHIPLVSKVLGPLRYDFFVGSLKGHVAPNSPWVHSEVFSFAPTANFQFGFQRTVIWGGKGHSPVTLHTFLKSFFDINDTTGAEKISRNDPGARFGAFNFSWRLPFLHHYVTLYTDSIAHDDVTPPSAPRRAAYRPGIYLSQFPGLPKLDLRVEAVSTDPPVLRSTAGVFNYFEVIQLDGYTNKGFIMGDWVGRQAKGGQAWLTWHLSADESIQVEYLNKKTPKDFIPLGTTQNQIKFDVIKRLPYGILMDAWVQMEAWKAPIYRTGSPKDTVVAAQFTWRPKLHTAPTKVK